MSQSGIVAASEHTPLLPGGSSISIGLPLHQALKPEIKQILKLTIPTYFTLVLEASLFATTIIVVGHLGTKELAAASLASMTGNVIAFSWIQGMVCALDTLCSQSWTANRSATSLHALKMAAILTLMTIPQIALFWSSEWILLALRQDKDVAKLASTYLKVMSAAVPAYAYFECTRRYLQAQGLVHVPTIIVGIVAPINILLNYLLVWLPPPYGLGFIGAPIAATVSTNLMFLGGLIYCSFFAPREGWGGFSKDIWRNWGDCWTLGISGVAMTASEWWAFEVLTFATSFLGPAALAANAAVGSLQFLFYQPALAISIAASVRLGNLLGEDSPDQARLVSKISVSMGVIIGGINMLVLAINKDWIGKIFTKEDDVLALVRSVLPLVALYQLTDSTAGVAYGVMRGCGQAPVAALITSFSYWVIAIPVSLAAMFYFHFGLLGSWMGVTLGLFLVSTGLTIYIFRYLDFEKEAEKARERSEAE